jgi:hypothetical protein
VFKFDLSYNRQIIAVIVITTVLSDMGISTNRCLGELSLPPNFFFLNLRN